MVQLPNPDQVENGVSMNGLVNTEEDGVFLEQMITRFLDEEWIEQDVHKAIGAKVRAEYVRARERGVSDVGELLLIIGAELENFDMADAYVNGWDVANKVSDLLMLRMERELCSCAGDFGRPEEGMTQTMQTMQECMLDVQDTLKSEFKRYKWLQEFLDKEQGWLGAEVAFLLTVGYRFVQTETAETDTDHDGGGRGASSQGLVIRRQPELTPLGWETLPMELEVEGGASFDGARVRSMMDLMKQDLPENGDATNIIIDSIAGVEMHKIMRERGTQDDLDRITLCKWLYVYNFLGETFPGTERFTPGHVDPNEDY